jgi:alpha-L-arabinofuranosidase
VWDRMVPEEEKKYGRLWMQITQRSAVAAGLGLNAFHRQADKLVMCNIAQIVNVLHSLLLTEGDKCIRTSTYYLHDMMRLHRSKQSLKLEAGDGTPLGLSVSASRKEKDLVITAINPKPDAGMKVNCTIDGAQPSSVTARLLYHADRNACNTFERPNEIVPKEHAVRVEGGGLRFELPPLGIVSAVVKLG